MQHDGQSRIVLSHGESFDSLPLVADDCVPTSMLLVLFYPYRIDSSTLARGLHRSLLAFPHLTGEVRGAANRFQIELHPRQHPIYLDIAESEQSFDQTAVEAMTLNELASRFAPAWCFNHRWQGAGDDTPLFHAQLTTCNHSPSSVLSLFASHMAIDGTGLMLLLSQATAYLHDASPPTVFHDRQALAIGEDSARLELPTHYVQCQQPSQDLLEQWNAFDSYSLGIFTVSVDAVRRRCGVTTLKDARLSLAAMLCRLLKRHCGELVEIALWCDPRGTAGIPKTYTGNTGCYLHLPISNNSDAELANRLRGMSTREGFHKITNTYRAIKTAEAHGDVVIWDAMNQGVVPVNLIPFSRTGLDWGQGQPAFGQMLTRNSHGLRIWTSPAGDRFLVEAYLQRPLPELLINRCKQLDLILSQRIES